MNGIGKLIDIFHHDADPDLSYKRPWEFCKKGPESGSHFDILRKPEQTPV